MIGWNSEIYLVDIVDLAEVYIGNFICVKDFCVKLRSNMLRQQVSTTCGSGWVLSPYYVERHGHTTGLLYKFSRTRYLASRRRPRFHGPPQQHLRHPTYRRKQE